MENQYLQRIDASPPAATLALKLLCSSVAGEEFEKLIGGALAEFCQAVGGTYAALLYGKKGNWTTLGQSGKPASLPLDLLAETLDRDAAYCQNDWSAAPLAARSGSGELLVMQATDCSLEAIDGLAALLGAVLANQRNRVNSQRRIRRLEAILEIAAQWSQTMEMDALLIQMAETSTRLIGAERASIFLWDQPNKILVGRPALGVEGNELRIPDDMGIVGQVVQTGEARRVDADMANEQQEIDRGVDQQLGFQTSSLLCVPLLGADGELFGAFELLNKREGNFSDEDESALTELAAHAAIALENTQQHEQLLQSRNQITDQAAQGVNLIGECPAIEALHSIIKRIANTDLSVLILGENGCGKEVVSQLIHYLSDRRNEPFIAVNCAAMTESLLESELFGHEKGAFTDAHETRAGKFELASGGTLFLDEIGDMSLGGQAKLLRVLEDKKIVRVGGSTSIHTDARVLAATNQNLAELVRQKKFREDLYFRLNVVTLDLPPLRQRGNDILLLADHFMADLCLKARRKIPKFTAAATKRLLAHSWPGNVRELRNQMERLVYLTDQDKIDADDLAFILSPHTAANEAISMDLPLPEATKEFQADYIQKHIQAARGNMTEAASRLGLHRSNLYRKMRQLDMETGEE